MNIQGLRAFESTVEEHFKRDTYRELFSIINTKVTKSERHCRIDALHFLALNFEAMVAEPLGQQRAGTMEAILRGEVREAIENDLTTIFAALPGRGRSAIDPSRDDRSELDGISSGEMLEAVGRSYRELRISGWKLWG